MMEVGHLVARASFKVDESGADRFKRRYRDLKGDTDRTLVADARFDTDDSGFREWDRKLDHARKESRRDLEAEGRLDVDRRGFDTYSRKTQEAARDTDRMERSSGRARGALGGLARGAGLAGAALAGGLALGAKKAWDEFEEAAKVGAQTRAVIESTGGAAKVSAEEVEALAGSLSVKAGVDDEVVQSGANVLLTFKDIRNEAGAGNDVFNQATTAALDMSVALDKDLKSSSIAIGKALNDPIKGVTALGRVGVQFTEQQKEQIKTMVESGDKMGAQKMILRELNSEFAGSAEAQARPLDKAKVAVMNLFEAIGGKLAPVVEGAASWLAKFVSGLTEGEGAAGGLAKMVRRARDALEDAGEAIVGVVDHFKIFEDGTSRAGGDWVEFVRSIGQYADELWRTVKGAFEAVKREFSGMGDSLSIIGTALLRIGDFVVDGMRRMLPAVKQVFGGLARVIRGVVDVIAGILTLDFGRVWDGVKRIVSGAVKAVAGAIRGMTAPAREGMSRLGAVILSGLRRVGRFFADLPGDLWGHLKRAISRVGRFASEVASEARQAGSGLVRGVVRFVRNLPGDLWDLLKRAVVRVGTWERQMIDKARDAGSGFLRSVIRFVANLPGDVGRELRQALAKVSDFVRDLLRKGGDAGENLVRGVIRGLGALPGQLASAARGLAQKVINFVKDKLGISSPSRVFAGIGKNIVQGLIQGMDFGDVASFVGKALGGVKDAAWNMIKGGAISVPFKLIPKVAKYLGRSISELGGDVLGYGMDQLGDLVHGKRYSAGLIGDDLRNYLSRKNEEEKRRRAQQRRRARQARDESGKLRGGKAGPGEGGPAVVYGEGKKDEWWISQEGDRTANRGWLREAAQALGGRVEFFRGGGKKPVKPLVDKGVAARAVAGADSGIENYSRDLDRMARDYGQKLRKFDQSQETILVEHDDGSVTVDEGQQQKRKGELEQLIAYQRDKIRAKLVAYQAAIENAVTTYRKWIGKLDKAITRASKGRGKKVHGREVSGYKTLRQKYAERVGELQDLGRDLDLDITDVDLDIGDLEQELGDVVGAAGRGPTPTSTSTGTDTGSGSDPAPVAQDPDLAAQNARLAELLAGAQANEANIAQQFALFRAPGDIGAGGRSALAAAAYPGPGAAPNPFLAPGAGVGGGPDYGLGVPAPQLVFQSVVPPTPRQVAEAAGVVTSGMSFQSYKPASGEAVG